MASDDCGASVHGRTCVRRAKAVVGGEPLCTQHAAVAARKAAEVAKEAAYWEEMFAPQPGEPYRTDPEWQSAMRAMIDGADEAVRICAIFRIHEIETGQPLTAAVLGIASAAPAAISRS